MLETLQPPGPHDVHVGTRITSYRGGPGGDPTHHVQVRPRWEPVSPCPRVAQVKARVNRSRWVTVIEQCNLILMLPRWVPRHQVLVRPSWDQRHEVQVRSRWEPESPGQVRPCLGSESPVTGEAQVEPESPGTENDKVRNSVTRIRSLPMGNRVIMSR